MSGCFLDMKSEEYDLIGCSLSNAYNSTPAVSWLSLTILHHCIGSFSISNLVLVVKHTISKLAIIVYYCYCVKGKTGFGGQHLQTSDTLRSSNLGLLSGFNVQRPIGPIHPPHLYHQMGSGEREMVSLYEQGLVNPYSSNMANTDTNSSGVSQHDWPMSFINNNNVSNRASDASLWSTISTTIGGNSERTSTSGVGAGSSSFVKNQWPNLPGFIRTLKDKVTNTSAIEGSICEAYLVEEIIVDKEWKKDVVDVRRVGDRIIVLKLVVGQDTFNVISGYAPQVGLAEHFKVKFWEDLEGVLQDIPQGEKVFLGGDLNGHVGSVARGFEGVHGGFGLGEMNGEGKSILEFSEALDLSIANTWFKKREEHLITYKSGGTCSQIDFFLIRKSDRKYCLNCKVIPGESLTTQHRVLVMDVRIRDRAKRRSPLVAPRIKWWHLKGEKQGIFQQKIWEGWCGQSLGSANDMWNKMSQEIIKVAKETLGESRGFGPRGKESWWWNENVQSKVRVKKECFKEWSRCRNSETWDKYKIARNETKKAVSEARAQAFDGLYQALGTRDGERSIYRLAKGRERKTRDLDQVKCVKDEEGKVLVHEKDIKERWKAYFHNLFNDRYGYDSSSLDTREEDRNYKYYRRIQKQEVKEALKRMSNGKAVGPDNIPIEVWKTLGDRGLEWLTELFNEIMRSKRMPEEWRRSTLVPIYKNKGDIQNCANYRGIKLMSHTMKLWERVIERRLRKETQVTENQFGFMPGRSTMEAIYLLRRVMEQYRMAQQDLHLIFIDLEKAYDRVPREILWKALEKKGVRVAYIRAIQDMYDRVSTSVRTQGGESDDFPITIGLHQGSTLSPYLFTLILDVLTEQIQEIAPRCMLFADDIVLLGESREELNERLETWRRALETHGFRLSRSKSEYMECKFNKRRRVSNSEVKIGDHIIPQVTRFKYLGSVIQDDGEIEGDVNHRIQAGWMKWRKASGVLCDAKVPIKLKGKFYRTAVRPAILYGTECWAVKSQHENKVGVAEMRMLRWMCGKTRQDKIRNEAIRERVGVAPIVEKMVENRLRWFGHVERRPIDSVVRRVDQMERRQTIRGRGRPKKTIREVIKKDLEINGLDRMEETFTFTSYYYPPNVLCRRNIVLRDDDGSEGSSIRPPLSRLGSTLDIPFYPTLEPPSLLSRLTNEAEVQARKAAINKVPEQIILSEVRRMVDEMKALNKKLEETETAIEDYFKPLDKEAEIIMKMQIQGEERTSEIMMQALEKQATLQQAEAEKNASKHQVNNAETNMNESEMMEEEKTLTEMLKALQQEVLLEKADTESDVNAHQADNSPINLSSASTTTSK
ncbi:LINE-1 retrotransposable element ORF2 protein [Glycine soja]|uniref:LINE-1 retrotransposable element ORF2 protein n=1 Tax=Glycine soja TaxID=3848 RepID=A0A445GG92_GLYSO|nr:LINE-1 retrotransposable element ORF2 protein [Glycine soja]